ncbi:MAG: hypothetical protein C0446_10040 [Chitinophaga sp.]|jgi:hypothetical protein|nr:hypothetical protein [Chitinophaga sp.]PJE47959.1 MAG: hypothetical protein CUR34_00315 [Sediminibacterium sp.] [Sediminibacterium sp. FEMGT703S]
MKLFNYFFVLTLFVAFASCATTAKFPVSSVVPAAEITAKKKTDDNKNNTLEITARNLASPDRLVPAGTNYSIWVVSKGQGTKNVGQLLVTNGDKASFKTTTAFDFDEVFITVENQSDLSYPTGVEISRTKF